MLARHSIIIMIVLHTTAHATVKFHYHHDHPSRRRRAWSRDTGTCNSSGNLTVNPTVTRTGTCYSSYRPSLLVTLHWPQFLAQARPPRRHSGWSSPALKFTVTVPRSVARAGGNHDAGPTRRPGLHRANDQVASVTVDSQLRPGQVILQLEPTGPG